MASATMSQAQQILNLVCQHSRLSRKTVQELMVSGLLSDFLFAIECFGEGNNDGSANTESIAYRDDFRQALGLGRIGIPSSLKSLCVTIPSSAKGSTETFMSAGNYGRIEAYHELKFLAILQADIGEHILHLPDFGGRMSFNDIERCVKAMDRVEFADFGHLLAIGVNADYRELFSNASIVALGSSVGEEKDPACFPCLVYEPDGRRSLIKIRRPHVFWRNTFVVLVEKKPRKSQDT